MNNEPLFTLNQIQELIANVSFARSDFIQRNFDTRRNLDDECGYPRSVSDITPWHYQDLYDREPIATRVVEVLAKESWQVQPIVYEEESPTKITPFEIAWDELSQSLRGEQSWFKDEEGSCVWEYLQRADILSGIGSFGVILLGFDDGMPLGMPVGGKALVGNEKPVLVKNTYIKEATHNWYMGDGTTRGPMEEPTVRDLLGTEDGTEEEYQIDSVPEKKEGMKLLYLRVFPESLVQIQQYESNPHSPRYGQPVRYSITLNDPNSRHSGIGLPLNTIYVHWTRIIHIADNLQASEIFGRPRLQPVYNRILDLRKTYGASGEAYWKDALMKLILETHPQLGGDVKINHQALKDMIENFDNGLTKDLILMGMTAKTVSPSIVDPTNHIATYIEAICILLGIPVRIFKGSERGELASSQDDDAWNDRIKNRQNTYLTPRVLVPFIDRLIAVGILPTPKDGYSIEWPDITSQSDEQRANVAAQDTQSLTSYVSGNLSTVITLTDFLTTVLKMDDEQALSIVENVQAQQEQEMTDKVDLSPTADDEPLPEDSTEETTDETTAIPQEDVPTDEDTESLSSKDKRYGHYDFSLTSNDARTEKELREHYLSILEGGE